MGVSTLCSGHLLIDLVLPRVLLYESFAIAGPCIVLVCCAFFTFLKNKHNHKDKQFIISHS